MKKKILSMVMAGVMVLSISTISQAASTEISKDDDGKYAAGKIDVSGEFAAPTIKVDIDTSAKKICINPYKLSTTFEGTTATDQLINKTGTIVNDSEVALAVNATVTGTLGEGSKASLATADVKDTETKNAIFAYLQVDNGTDVTPAAYNAKNQNQVAFTTKPTTKKAIVTLADKSAAADKKGAAYKICGSAAPNPTTMWTDKDVVNFEIVYDFEPRVIATTTP